MINNVIDLTGDLDSDLFDEYLNDAFEHLELIEQGVLTLESNPNDQEAINDVFRSFHTFKGNSGFLDLHPISAIAHKYENLLEELRAGDRQVCPDVIDFILKGRDKLQEFISEIASQLNDLSPRSMINIDIDSLTEALDKFMEDGVLPSSECEQVSDDRDCAASITHFKDAVGGAEYPSHENMPSEFVGNNVDGEIDDVVVTGDPFGEAFERALQETARIEASNQAQAASAAVKVATHKLDSLVDLIGEFVIAQSLVMESLGHMQGIDDAIDQRISNMTRISKDLQKTALSLRTKPVSDIFNKMQRLVRDVSHKVNKEVKLHVSGEHTEMDRNILDKIQDAISHMIRNAVDHGIEDSDRRAACGKLTTGNIYLSAAHIAGNIVISIRDDGAGLDPDKILFKAEKIGLIHDSEGMTRDEILRLILEPGFSTATRISDISGRGVGMDVVLQNITNLGGTIDIVSNIGKSTEFRITLPLTLAIIEGLTLVINQVPYIIPLSSVKETFLLKGSDLRHFQGRTQLLKVRDEFLPVVDLKHHFNAGRRCVTHNQIRDSRVVLLVEHQNTKRCLLVDEITGHREVVIKKLDESLQVDPTISGATILGNGKVCLILDPSAIINLSHIPPNAQTQTQESLVSG